MEDKSKALYEDSIDAILARAEVRAVLGTHRCRTAAWRWPKAEIQGLYGKQGSCLGRLSCCCSHDATLPAQPGLKTRMVAQLRPALERMFDDAAV